MKRNLLQRLIGCFGISVWFAAFLFIGITVISGSMSYNASVASFVVAFTLTMIFLLACNLTYLANKKLWDDAESAKKSTNKKNLLRLLPNVKFFADMCEFVGTFNAQDKS